MGGPRAAGLSFLFLPQTQGGGGAGGGGDRHWLPGTHPNEGVIRRLRAYNLAIGYLLGAALSAAIGFRKRSGALEQVEASARSWVQQPG